MNMVHASVKSRKNVISLWLLRLKVSLSFNYYILGSHFISSSQFRKPFKHVLNFSQEFRLQWYSGVHKVLLAEIGCMCWTAISVRFNLSCLLCSFIHACPQFSISRKHKFSYNLSWGLHSSLLSIPKVFPFLIFPSCLFLTWNCYLFFPFLALSKPLSVHVEEMFTCAFTNFDPLLFQVDFSNQRQTIWWSSAALTVLFTQVFRVGAPVPFKVLNHLSVLNRLVLLTLSQNDCILTKAG